MELVLKAKDIRVESTGRDVLDINELEVYDYDRIGLLGANGAGKSTLFKVLLGELTPAGCKINHLGELAYIPQLDEVSLQEEFVSGKVVHWHSTIHILLSVRKLIKYLEIRYCLKMHLFKFR